MRVAIDLRSIMPGGRISGVENYLINVMRYLSRDERNYFGFYNSFGPVALPEFEKSFRVKSTKVPNKIFNLSVGLFGYPKFEDIYGNFDILWMPDVRPFAIKDKTKLAVTVHDMSPVTHPKYYSLKRRIWHSFVNYKKTFKRADLIFADSEYTKYDLIKLFDLPKEKIKVVHLAIDHSKFRMDLDERLKHKVRERYNLPDNFILSISTVEPRKNISSLVTAFEKIEDPEAHLVIAGRLGWLYKDLLKQVDSSPKKDKIKFINYVEEEDKAYLISLSQIVCYPSYYEGFGFVPLEAMACGVPVVTSARTSIPEVVGDAALLIEPYSVPELVVALGSLLNDQNLRSTMIQKGIERAKQFDWQNTIKEIDRHLSSL